MGVGVLLGLALGLTRQSLGQRHAPLAAVAAARAVLEGQAAAWNRGDLDGFLRGYWRDPALTFYSGADVRQGFDETAERYRQKYQRGGAKMGQLTFSDLLLEPLGPDAVFVRGRWRLDLKDEPNGLFTLVMRRVEGAWVVVHDHTSAA